MHLRRLEVFALAFVVLLSLSVPVQAAGGGKKKGKPNIVFIMSDDHASAAIGAYASSLKA